LLTRAVLSPIIKCRALRFRCRLSRGFELGRVWRCRKVAENRSQWNTDDRIERKMRRPHSALIRNHSFRSASSVFHFHENKTKVAERIRRGTSKEKSARSRGITASAGNRRSPSSPW
jgi:hypothetical protein